MKGRDFISYFYGISSSSVSNFFQGNLNSNNKSNFNNSGLNDLYNSLGDYGTIRSGTYSKLLKSYYAKTSTDSTVDSNDTNKGNKVTAEDASALKSAADALSSSKFTEENRTKITDSITKFVDSYNDLVDAAGSSKNNAVTQKYKSLTNLTDKYSKLLSSVGITVNSDKTLSINKDDLKNADLTTLKSTFSGPYSYTSQMSNYASLIYSASTNGVGSIYTNSGTISTLSTNSILDTYA